MYNKGLCPDNFSGKNCLEIALKSIFHLSGQKCWKIGQFEKKNVQLKISNFENNFILYLKINN